MRRVALAAILLVGGCDLQPWSGQRVKARQAAIDPPSLWRVEAVGAGVAPVQLCADSILLTGFRDPRPSVGGRRCERTGRPVIAGPHQRLSCQSGGVRFDVVTTSIGAADDFSVRMRAAPVGGEAFEQTRRYTRLGACPEGWKIGDHTDQQGRRRSDAAG